MTSEYFDWLCNLVGGYGDFYKLLRHLHFLDFYYVMDKDGNRAEDGVGLRYRYCHRRCLSSPEAKAILDMGPCSVLEMMIALALRCEDDLMNNSEIGNRTGQWFWDMISSLGLSGMDDRHYDEDEVDWIIDHFLDRRYEPDGRGGLFYLPKIHQDLRNVEIWYQAMWYLSEFKE